MMLASFCGSNQTMKDAAGAWQVHYSGPIFTHERSNSPLAEEIGDVDKSNHVHSPVSPMPNPLVYEHE
jgi:hypothetical protein